MEDTTDRKIVFGDDIRQIEPLTNMANVGERVVTFGNTGFRIAPTEDPSLIIFDFLPEYYSFRSKDKMAKHASMLSAALLAMYGFLNSPEEKSGWQVDDSQVTKLAANTNIELTRALDKLFTEHGHANMATVHRSGVEIDFQAFKNLPKDDSLINYLTKVSQRALGKPVEVLKF